MKKSLLQLLTELAVAFLPIVFEALKEVLTKNKDNEKEETNSKMVD